MMIGSSKDPAPSRSGRKSSVMTLPCTLSPLELDKARAALLVSERHSPDRLATFFHVGGGHKNDARELKIS